MTRTKRHTGFRLLLLILWLQVGTANVLPCALSCLLEEHGHHHMAGHDQSPIGHHTPGAKVSAPESCGTPQLLLIAFVRPALAPAPVVEVRLNRIDFATPQPLHSIVPAFNTPPPKLQSAFVT